MSNPKLSLDVASPIEVARVLREAADTFGSDALGLEASWQECGPGRVWMRIARELDRAAMRCEQITNQEGWR
jgi:hypothetical protein